MGKSGFRFLGYYGDGIMDGKKIGIKEGEEIGIKKGEDSKTREIAQSWKQKGMEISLISEFSGLSEEEIEKL